MGLFSSVRSSCIPVVLVLFLDGCSRVGIIKTMGILFDGISESLHMTSTDLGIAIGLLLAVGNVASPIVVAVYQRSSPRLFFLVGAMTSPCCVIIASLATNKSTIFIVFAISGIGHNMVRMASVLALSVLAGENFNLLYSLAASGFSIGIVGYPFIADLLMDAYGWRGVLLILAGFMFHSVPLVLAIKVPSEDLTSDEDANVQDIGSRDAASYSGTPAVGSSLPHAHSSTDDSARCGFPTGSKPCPDHADSNIRSTDGDTSRFRLPEEASTSDSSFTSTDDAIPSGHPTAWDTISQDTDTNSTCHETTKDSSRTPLLTLPEEENQEIYASEQPLPFYKHKLENNARRLIVLSLEITNNFKQWFFSSLFYTDPWSNFIFLSYTTGHFVFTGWHGFLIPHAIQRGITLDDVLFLTLSAAIGSMFGRFCVAILTHRLIQPVDMYLALNLLNVLSLVIDVCIPNFFVMLATSFCSGGCVASKAVLGILVLRQRAPPSQMSVGLAALEITSGANTYLGGYIGGRIADMFSSYNATFKLLAVVDVFSFLLMLPVKIVKRPRTDSECQRQ